MTHSISVEVVFVTPDAQAFHEISLPAGATVADAIQSAGLAAEFPDYPLNELPVGIWGRPVARNQALKDSDRVEVYRELLVDPMEARRLRASAPDPDPYESR